MNYLVFFFFFLSGEGGDKIISALNSRSHLGGWRDIGIIRKEKGERNFEFLSPDALRHQITHVCALPSN